MTAGTGSGRWWPRITLSDLPPVAAAAVGRRTDRRLLTMTHGPSSSSTSLPSSSSPSLVNDRHHFDTKSWYTRDDLMQLMQQRNAPTGKKVRTMRDSRMKDDMQPQLDKDEHDPPPASSSSSSQDADDIQDDGGLIEVLVLPPPPPPPLDSTSR